jgi:hypothetical protein
MGIGEDSVAQFRRVVTLPKAWTGQVIELNFDAPYWFWGLLPNAKLWINGKPSPVENVPGENVTADKSGGFSIDVSSYAAQGKIVIALEIDGHVGDQVHIWAARTRSRPAGVTGMFYLQETPQPIKTISLVDGWQAATDVNVLTPVKPNGSYSYLENKFTLPAVWPGKRLILRGAGLMCWIILNDHVVRLPAWDRSLDISRLVHTSGDNILRWTPSSYSDDTCSPPTPSRQHTQPVQDLRLEFLN